MIEQIIQMLQIAEFTSTSEAIEIAKGKHKIEDNLKSFKKQFNRAKPWQSKR